MSAGSEPVPELRRAWRIITWAGFLGSTYYLLCISGAPRVKYLTELDATPFDFGVISSLGAVALAFQILGSTLGHRLRRRKPLWMTLLIAHRLLFLTVLFAPVLPFSARGRIVWILTIFFCHDALAQTSVPLWFSWMGDLVPRESISRHWASRQRFITEATIAVMIAIAFVFHFFETTGHVILGFTILACIGVGLGVVDILLFLAVPEPPYERDEGVHWRDALLQPLRDRSFRPFLLFMGYWHFAVFAAAPFFGLYVLEELKLSVMTLQLLGTASALGVVVSSRFWGLVCDSYGYRPVLEVLAVCKTMTPLAYFIAPRRPEICIPYLVVIWFVDGVLNAGMGLAIQGPLFKFTPRRNRTTYIAAANFLSVGVMASIAPLLAGRAIQAFETVSVAGSEAWSFTGYHWAFAASAALRLSAVLFASRIAEPQAVPVRTLIKQGFSKTALGVSRLVYRLHEGKDDAARAEAAEALGRLRHPLAIGGLIQALHDPALIVRQAAVDALGRVGASEATEALATSLFDAESGIQGRAARALGRIHDVDALRALLRNVRDKESVALGETIDTLGEIGNDIAILPLVWLFHEVKDEATRTRIA
ncbi:MAG TPA: MFS transporter, partial [Candidatus Hydrogenedentes bacterium]|nr:MFS transporter [Candidatus Hydrogenedentota bacterium]